MLGEETARRKSPEQERLARAQAENSERQDREWQQELERRKQAKAQATERERRAQEYEAQRPAREQAAPEAAQERARFAALPSTRLLNGYRFFAHVRFCREARDGYASIYINDVEYERAEKVIKAIAEQTTKVDAAMNTDDVWEQALQSIAGHLQPYRATQDGQRQICQHSLQQL